MQNEANKRKLIIGNCKGIDFLRCFNLLVYYKKNLLKKFIIKSFVVYQKQKILLWFFFILLKFIRILPF